MTANNTPNPNQNIHQWNIEKKTLFARMDILEENLKHALEQQKKWQRNYFELKDVYEKLVKAYQNVEANNRSRD